MSKPYNKKDHYYHQAKKEGYLARSAYKLQEMQKKFNLIKRGSKVLDLGCAPGAWSQVVLEHIGKEGALVGLDLEAVTLPTTGNARFFVMDAFSVIPEQFPEAPFDVILSDMAPKTSGIRVRDQALSQELCQKALELCDTMLKPGGKLVMKIFEGGDMKAFEAEVRKRFQDVKKFRPDSTRQASMEIYMIASGKK
jgi:23S rRNA (uridine2552-2'-O)-methyltransferase